MVFLDDVTASREVTANAVRIEGWRRTPMYRVFQEVKCAIIKPFKRGFLIVGPCNRISSTAVRLARSEDLTCTINYGDCGP
jgi:hypothetical protein